MAVAIRLTRVGATKRPAYRVVAIDKRRPRDGRALEILGYYDPLTEPATVQLNADRIKNWIGRGAQPSDTVVRLMRQADEAAKATAPDKPKRASKPAGPSRKARSKAAAAAEAVAETSGTAADSTEVTAEAPDVTSESTKATAEATGEPEKAEA